MPGPKSTPNGTIRKGGEPNRKTAKRLNARIKAFTDVDKNGTSTKHGFDMHKPGSQNRNK